MVGRSQGAARASQFAAMLVVVGSLWAPPPAIAAETYSEAAVKAAFIHRFSGYVEWPPEAPAATALTIAVMGDPEVAGLLESLVSRTAAARPTRVVRVSQVSELGHAQILFIGSGSRRDLRSTIAAVGAKPVLIVTDDARGMELGATINFLVVDRRVRFEVSLLAAQRSGLKISSDLLSVAARVLGALRTDTACVRLPPAGLTNGACPTRVVDASH